MIGSDKKKANAFVTTNGVQFPTVIQQIRKGLDLSVPDSDLPENSHVEQMLPYAIHEHAKASNPEEDEKIVSGIKVAQV